MVPILIFKNGQHSTTARFSPDGKQIVTASGDGTARVWDSQAGEPVTGPMKHGDGVCAAQFSPDGLRILTGSHDRTARVWDAQTGRPLTEPLINGGPVMSAHFSSEGKRIVTASFNGKARVWDIGPTPEKYPDWLLPLSEALSGQVLNTQSVLEQTRLNRLETINRIRQRLSQAKADDDWVVWGRWLLGDRATRTISPFSKVTLIEKEAKEKMPESVDGQTRKVP